MANTKKVVDDEVIEEVTPDEVIVEKKTTKKSIEKKVPKKFEKDDMIECRSVTAGELNLIGFKSHNQYTWADYGDTAYVSYEDLQSLQSRRSGFLIKPRFIIEDEELVEQWGSMLKPIYNKINDQDIETLFKMDDTAKFRAILTKLPDGMKEAIKTKAVQMIQTEELHDIRLIKIIDEVLGTELVEMFAR